MSRIVTSRRSLRALALASAALVGPMLFSSAALAQASSDGAAADEAGVIDIVVTAQRREESLQDVPLSIVAIGSEAIKNNNITEASRLEQIGRAHV